MLVKMLTKTAPGPSLKTPPLSVLGFAFVNSSVLLLADTLFPSTWPLGNLSLFGSFDAWASSLEPFSRGAKSDSPCASFGSSGSLQRSTG